jgi:5-methylcytosine-specific restriction endonuclease McrA
LGTWSYYRLAVGNPYKKAAAKYGAPYEPGITRLAVLKRDGWICQMKPCRFSDPAINPSVPTRREGMIPDERGTVDHIIPLSDPRTPGHVWINVRAAHRLCNREAFRTSKKASTQ